MLLAAARTFKDRIIYESTVNSQIEAELCTLLIRQWRLPKMIPCLDVVIIALKARVAEIRRILNEAIFQNSTDEQIGNLPDYFHLDYLAELDVACSAFDTFYKLKSSPKWALCLDELEIAPTWLQNLAFSQQRSTEEGFLFKLSTSPIPKTLGLTEARPKQDFRLICIWNHAGRDDKGFEESLARSVLKRRLGADIEPEAMFGRSDLVVEAENNEVGKYGRGSAEWNLFREASKWDESLRALLKEASLDPNDPVTDDIKVRDSLLRKAKPVAILRSAFLKEREPGRLVKRSRKLATIYYGCEVIYRVSDGNPRKLIGILGDLCERLVKNKDGGFHKLSENEQAEVLTRASLQFSGYVHALPGSITPLGDSVQEVRVAVRSRIEASPDRDLRIFVDYTCMTRSWYAGIIEAVRSVETKKPIQCIFGYSPAVFSNPPEPSANAIVEPIAGFCSLDVPEKPTALIIGLGYERSRALGLIEYIDPAVFFVFYTDPVLDPQFRDVVLANNAPVFAKLKKDAEERVFTHPLNDLQRTSNILASLCAGLREDHRVILAPLGVKPFSLLCLLMAVRFRDIDVWRVSPGTKAPPQDRKPIGQLLSLSVTFQ